MTLQKFQTLNIPAKALLFGEYGVLFGFPAIGVTFFDHTFTISFALKRNQKNNLIQISSDFFLPYAKKLAFNIDKKPADSSLDFFFAILQPWEQELHKCHLDINILTSFSPQLGFGSSSAIIAACTRFLWETFYPNQQIIEWHKIEKSLKLAQGGGSGYDVAMQIEASRQPLTQRQFWLFDPQTKKTDLLEIHPLLVSQMGYFVQTHHYSETKKHVKAFLSSAEKKQFAQKHGLVSRQFIELINKKPHHDSWIAQLTQLCLTSQQIAKEQGLIPNLLFEHLKPTDIYKTMGAGHGDCLWFLHKPKDSFFEIVYSF